MEVSDGKKYSFLKLLHFCTALIYLKLIYLNLVFSLIYILLYFHIRFLFFFIQISQKLDNLDFQSKFLEVVSLSLMPLPKPPFYTFSHFRFPLSLFCTSLWCLLFTFFEFYLISLSHTHEAIVFYNFSLEFYLLQYFIYNKWI